MADAAPWDLSSELALMRALLQDVLDRYPDGQALPQQDIGMLFGMIEKISQLVERISKILNNTALTQAELQYIQIRIVDLLTTYVPDADSRTQFMAELTASLGLRRADDEAHGGTNRTIDAGTGG